MLVEGGSLAQSMVLPHRASRIIEQQEGVGSHIAHRTSTIKQRYQAIEQVILVMRERLEEGLSLDEMAEIAQLSPFHFNRVFRCITGISPSKFLSALRLDTAKKLLLTTNLSVTEVCFEVGYSSLGTFTTQFAQCVGVPPRQLRRLIKDFPYTTLPTPDALTDDAASDMTPEPACTGCVSLRGSSARSIFIGLYPTPLPQGRPVACSFLMSPGKYRITGIPDGTYYVLATASPWSQDPLAWLMPDVSTLHVGSSETPIQVEHGQVLGLTNLTLRPVQLTDPAIPSALLLLLAEHLSRKKTMAG